MSAALVPRLVVVPVAVAEPPSSAPVAEWLTNAGEVLRGYHADGYGWLVADRVAMYRFASSGPVAAFPVADEEAVEGLWFSSVLPLVVQARGTQVVHASAIAGDRGIVALCGVSGAGKTTLGAALRQRGHELVADDALAFYSDGGQVVAQPLPFTLRLRPGSEKLLGQHGPHTGSTYDRPTLLQAVVLLRPAQGDGAASASLTPLAPGEAVSAELVAELLPHLYCFSLAEGKDALVRDLFALLRNVHVFALRYPHDRAGLEAACKQLEELL